MLHVSACRAITRHRLHKYVTGIRLRIAAYCTKRDLRYTKHCTLLLPSVSLFLSAELECKMFIYIYIHTHTHIYIYIHTHIYVVCVYICIYIHTYIHTYTHTHTVGYARTNDPTTNECYNEQSVSIKSGYYNEHRCYNERFVMLLLSKVRL